MKTKKTMTVLEFMAKKREEREKARSLVDNPIVAEGQGTNSSPALQDIKTEVVIKPISYSSEKIA